jgi:hypothetical protein
MRFAILEIKYIFALLLMKFKFTLDEKTNRPLKLSPSGSMLEDENGIWINFEPLKQ